MFSVMYVCPGGRGPHVTIIHDASGPTSGTAIRWLMKHVRLARGRYASYLTAFLFRTVMRKKINVNYQGPLTPTECERQTIFVLSLSLLNGSWISTGSHVAFAFTLPRYKLTIIIPTIISWNHHLILLGFNIFNTSVKL